MQKLDWWTERELSGPIDDHGHGSLSENKSSLDGGANDRIRRVLWTSNVIRDGLFSLRSKLHTVGEKNCPREFGSNPKRLDLREMQPVTITCMTLFARADVRQLPTAIIKWSDGQPLVIGGDLDVLGSSGKQRGLHKTCEGSYNAGRYWDRGETGIRQGGREEGSLSVR